MEVHQDFKDLLELFNKNEVEYLIVGSYALAFHGAPRFTGDIDILVRPTELNAEKVLRALGEFGFGSLALGIKDFTKTGSIVQLGVPPVRVDLLTSISAVSWEEADQSKEPGSFGPVPVHYIGKAAFIKNKAASGRKKDLADIEALEQ